MKGQECSPTIASRIAVYSLAKALAISPLEVYSLPVDLFQDMMIIHGQIESMKADEIDKATNKLK